MHEEYMRQALALAQEAAAHGEVPVGCVIVREGRIVGRGRNRREEKQHTSSHAEMEAIRQANEALARVDGAAQEMNGNKRLLAHAQRVRAGRAQHVFLCSHGELQIVDAKHVRRLLFLQSRFILL